MNLQKENEALKEACVKALESAKRNRLNLKEVMAENEELKQTIASLQREVQMLRNARRNDAAYKRRMLEAAEDTKDAVEAMEFRSWWHGR